MTGPDASGRPALSVNKIPSLDGIRAISFLIVFVAHAGLDAIVPGGFGVTVFFFLSGYLITSLMRAEFERNGHVNFKHFWLRRALRILPPFYLVLLVALALTIALDPPGTLDGHAVAAQLLHVTNYWSIYHGFAGVPAGTGVYWSLAVEEHFYVLFPWLFVALCHAGMTGKGKALTFWALCAALLLWRLYLVHVGHVSDDRTYMGSDTRVDSILFGSALAVWHNPVIDGRPRNESWWKWLYLPLALAVLLLGFAVRDHHFRETWRYSMQGLALTVVFVCAISFSDWPVFRFLNWGWLRFLGVLSYTLYLIHYVVLFLLERHAGMHAMLPRAVAALAISIGLAYAMQIAVERPCARLRRRLTD